MARTFLYQNKVILVFALVLFLWVTQAYLKKKVDYFLYVEVIHVPGNYSNS